MQNHSEIQRPHIPIWGSEITTPSEFQDSINENICNSINDSSEPDPSVSDSSTDPSKYLNPTEEYLEITKRLIESNTLPPRTNKKLKELYIKYKSKNGHGSILSDMTKRDHSQKSSMKGLQVNQGQIPSTSKQDQQLETSSTDSEESEKLDQKESSSSEESPLGDFTTPWFGPQDFMFGRPCDADTIKIDDVFSDFTLCEAGHENKLKKRIRKWMNSVLLVSNEQRNSSTIEERRSK